MQGSDFCLHISVCLCAQNAFSLFRSLLLFFRSALQLLAQPFFSPPPPIPSLNISWMQESAEKLLDYREYYCGLKYVTLYVGALSPRAIRIV